jgi:uncharacterized membrane protein
MASAVWMSTAAAYCSSGSSPFRTTGGFSVRSTEESAEQILKRRYARGEIDREDYERRLDDIRR